MSATVVSRTLKFLLILLIALIVALCFGPGLSG